MTPDQRITALKQQLQLVVAILIEKEEAQGFVYGGNKTLESLYSIRNMLGEL